jgi:hypothetical protein
MISVDSPVVLGGVNVMTSDDGGLNAEQVTELAMDKIVKISDTAPPAIRDQAQVFRSDVQKVVYYYIELARREERATIARKMDKLGNSEMADLVRRI